jgi:hypothetical protein
MQRRITYASTTATATQCAQCALRTRLDRFFTIY